MKYALLVAAREFAENAKTKGFWIGIFLLPLIIVGSALMIALLSESTPTRYITVNDQSGRYLDEIVAGVDRLYQRQVLGDFSGYVQQHTPLADRNDVSHYTEVHDEALTRFIERGGVDIAANAVRPFLSPDAPAFDPPKPRYQLVPLPNDLMSPDDLEATADQMREYLKGDRKIVVGGEDAELFAFVQIPRDIDDHLGRPGEPGPDNNKGIQYWSTNLADNAPRDVVSRVMNDEVRFREYTRLGVDVAAVDQVSRTYVPVVSLNPRKAAGDEEVNVADQIRQWAPVGFVYVLWIALFTISQMLLNNTIEEKSNKIIEVLLSSVTAHELMMGKLLGIASVGLTMMGAWILTLLVVLFSAQGPQLEIAGLVLQVLVSSGLIIWFLVYFVLGYFLYAGVFLAIGSLCSTLKDAQNLMGPIMLAMMVPLFTMMFIPRDPNGTLATIMSWIPLYTPFVMMNRAAADPPLFDIVGTLILLTATTALVLYGASKVFRIGILRTGQPPRIVELWRWVTGRV
ncbi:MAG: hypothetical protein CMQ05_04055 [Gammaproteobacteria bacterium]|nr:hypothetical protein [Gammaproteobacteria bacterium]RPG24026.1 MAG: ABC transporter permease [Gammaproteobacteria bacterium TMED50]